MRVLFVASEAFGLVKTGGLADVVGALPAALAEQDIHARLLIPEYPGLAARCRLDPAGAIELGDPLGAGEAWLVPFELPDARLAGWLLRCPTLYDRPGGPYLDPEGRDHPDQHLRFGLLGRVGALLATVPALTGFDVQLVHAHDWQAGTVGATLATFGGRRPPVVFTAHNMHFTGRFDPSVLGPIGLPAWQFQPEGLEFWGAVSFLKAGLFYADHVTTVSPRYAVEIQSAPGGEGFEGLLSARASSLTGILNGIDTRAWDPSTDPALARGYDADARLGPGKAACKRDLLQRLDLPPDPAVPLCGMVGRLTEQKGVALLLQCLPTLLDRGASLAVLGSGDGGLQDALRHAAATHPGRVAFVQGYDEALSHRMIAGCDLLAVPSLFEPCGLTQMYAQRYGTIPVVRRTGGLADTVVDADADPDRGSGFCFDAPHPEALADALRRALDCLADPARCQRVQHTMMALSRGWSTSAAAYARLYRGLVGAGRRAV